jgi:hypothetical protein
MTGHKLVITPNPDKPHLIRLFDLIDLNQKPKSSKHGFKIYSRIISTGAELITYRDTTNEDMLAALEAGAITQIIDLYHQDTYYHSKKFGKVYTTNN